jgi:hypothetical protein
MRNKPNFQKSRQPVTLDMIRTYNDNCRKKRKKNKPKTHQKRTKNEQKRIKTNQNEQNSTQKTTKNPFQTQFFIRLWRTSPPLPASHRFFGAEIQRQIRIHFVILSGYFVAKNRYNRPTHTKDIVLFMKA